MKRLLFLVCMFCFSCSGKMVVVSPRSVYWSAKKEYVLSVRVIGEGEPRVFDGRWKYMKEVEPGLYQYAISYNKGVSMLRIPVSSAYFSEDVEITINYPVHHISVYGENISPFVQLYAFVYDEFGRRITDRPVFWESTLPEVIVVDQNGLATALKPYNGVVQLKVRCEDVTSTFGIFSYPVENTGHLLSGN